MSDKKQHERRMIARSKALRIRVTIKGWWKNASFWEKLKYRFNYNRFECAMLARYFYNGR